MSAFNDYALIDSGRNCAITTNAFELISERRILPASSPVSQLIVEHHARVVIWIIDFYTRARDDRVRTEPSSGALKGGDPHFAKILIPEYWIVRGRGRRR